MLPVSLAVTSNPSAGERNADVCSCGRCHRAVPEPSSLSRRDTGIPVRAVRAALPRAYPVLPLHHFDAHAVVS